jgi:hypothetical protein
MKIESVIYTNLTYREHEEIDLVNVTHRHRSHRITLKLQGQDTTCTSQARFIVIVKAIIPILRL